MKPEFRLIIFSDALFVALYLLWNWNEYSVLSTLYRVAIKTYFPLTVNFSGSTQDGNGLIFFPDANLGLMLFLVAIFVNLYLAYRLQRSKETKQNPSQTELNISSK